MISLTPDTSSAAAPEIKAYSSERLAISPELPEQISEALRESQVNEKKLRWLIFAVAIFLVSVPVFIQAPMVRYIPWISLGLTPLLFGLGGYLLTRSSYRVWGDLLIGFSWTWLSGSIYWGWLRWEPLWHLPIESIGLPFALWGIARQRGKLGNFFFLGSLFGTAVTDAYFYLVDLIPHWRDLMRADTSQVSGIFQSAIAKVYTSWGLSWALVLATILLAVSLCSMRYRKTHWWAFAGAVLSTILVDGLFWLAASTA